ncbi:hypothetical protein IC582_009233 [Cucumis melo]
MCLFPMFLWSQTMVVLLILLHCFIGDDKICLRDCEGNISIDVYGMHFVTHYPTVASILSLIGLVLSLFQGLYWA